MKMIDLTKCPRLELWIGEREGFLSAYLAEIQHSIPALLAAQADMEGLPNSDFEALGHVARIMGCVANDLDIIHRELFPE